MKSVVQEEFDRLRVFVGTNAYEAAFESFCVKYENDSEAKNEINRLIKEGIAAVGKRLEHLEAIVNLQTA